MSDKLLGMLCLIWHANSIEMSVLLSPIDKRCTRHTLSTVAFDSADFPAKHNKKLKKYTLTDNSKTFLLFKPQNEKQSSLQLSSNIHLQTPFPFIVQRKHEFLHSYVACNYWWPINSSWKFLTKNKKHSERNYTLLLYSKHFLDILALAA